MADEQSGKKPDIEGGSGAQKGNDASEGSGRGGRCRFLLYTCWNDGSENFVSANWGWFTCWRCGALNYM